MNASLFEDLKLLIHLILESDENVDESSGAGAAGGFSLPLGMVPTQGFSKKKTKVKNRKKKNRMFI